MDRYSEILLPILFDSGMLLAAIAAVVGLVISLWLILFPNNFARFEEIASRSISLRRSMRPLEIARNIDRHIYRHHKSFGLLIIIASTYTIYTLLFDIMPSRLENLLGLQLSPVIASWLLHAFDILLLCGNLFALIIGMIMYVRPSALKNFEARANQWVSLREQTSWLESKVDLPDKLIRTQPRTVGLVLLIFSIYLISILSVL